MANLYIFFDKRSPRRDGSGTLKLACTHQRKTAYESLDIHIKPEEWNADKQQVILRPDKKFQNIIIRKRLSDAEQALVRLSMRPDFDAMTSRDILTVIMRSSSDVDGPADGDYIVPVYNEYITLARKTTTAQTYRYSLNNLKIYDPCVDTLRFKDINSSWLRRYQNWLLNVQGMSVNGANVYLRNLRTVFNYALNNEYTKARYPFRDVDMSTTEPDKRSIAYDKFLEWATYELDDERVIFRDLFMLSFYLRGIRPTDLLHAKWSNVEDGRLEYCPEKLNGRTKLSVKIEPEAMEIIEKYKGEDYLLKFMETRVDYRTFCKKWNKAIKAIGDEYAVEKKRRDGDRYYAVKHHCIIPFITVYYARTCWASYAYDILDTPMDIISQGLGHKSGLRVTNFYVKRDERKVDAVNRQLIDRIKADIESKLNSHGKEEETQEGVHRA